MIRYDGDAISDSEWYDAEDVPSEGLSMCNDEIADLKEELNWWRGYAKSIEAGFKEIRAIINESQGVVGYHLNGNIATWDELINGSLFDLCERDIIDVKAHPTIDARDVLYIKSYPNLPCCVQYTPVYGGVKYIKDKS